MSVPYLTHSMGMIYRFESKFYKDNVHNRIYCLLKTKYKMLRLYCLFGRNKVKIRCCCKTYLHHCFDDVSIIVKWEGFCRTIRCIDIERMIKELKTINDVNIRIKYIYNIS